MTQVSSAEKVVGNSQINWNMMHDLKPILERNVAADVEIEKK